jgi:hypothetical protein
MIVSKILACCVAMSLFSGCSTGARNCDTGTRKAERVALCVEMGNIDEVHRYSIYTSASAHKGLDMNEALDVGRKYIESGDVTAVIVTGHDKRDNAADRALVEGLQSAARQAGVAFEYRCLLSDRSDIDWDAIHKQLRN